MNLFLKTFLFLSLILCFGACKGPENCVSYQEDHSTEIQPVIHLTDDSPILYQASFEVLKYRFSGLIAFRNISNENEIRIVLLSEVGLKLMEFSFAGQEIINTYCSPVITKKSIPKFIGSFLEMLIYEPQCKSICFYQEGKKSSYFCKAKSDKIILEKEDKGRTSMHLKKSRKKSVQSIYIDSTSVPDEITVQMKYRTTILLKKVVNAFK